MRKPEDVLMEREKTHGSYTWTSKISQNIKDTLRTGLRWHEMTPSQSEALDNIATKMARIVSGDPEFKDHWEDIEGYARLINDGH